MRGVVYRDLVNTDCCFCYMNLSGYGCTFLPIRRLIINLVFTGDLDYIHTTLMFTFGPQDVDGVQEECDLVDIIDDLIGNEPDEEFSVTLINVTASGSEEACITIIDNDSE